MNNNNSNNSRDMFNCKIYTPEVIAKFMIDSLGVVWNENFKIIEPACGSGNISIPLVKEFLYHFDKNSDVINILENNFIFFDNDEDALSNLKYNLNNLLKEFKITKRVNWNIQNIDFIDIEKINFENVTHSICNPPYIASKTLSEDNRARLRENFLTCQKGNYDIYYAFMEYLISITSITSVYITPNSFLQNKSASYLRELISSKNFTIFDFPHQNLFKNANVKTAITVVNNYSGTNRYIDSKLNDKLIYECNVINDFVLNKSIDSNINNIGKYFDVSSGIATLNDKFYIIKSNEIILDEENSIVFEKNEKQFTLNKSLLKKTVRPRTNAIEDYVIFPYNNNTLEVLDMSQFKDYMIYHNECKKDKDVFGYGRKQGIKNIAKKQLILPKLSNRLYAYDYINVLTIAGIYVTVKDKYLDDEEMLINWFKDNLDSIFNYLKPISKHMGDEYYTFSPVNIKNFETKLYL